MRTKAKYAATLMVALALFWYLPADHTLAQAPPPIPERAAWESHMITYGNRWCAYLSDMSHSSSDRLATSYYDAERVFFQIAEYTGNSSWTGCAQAAEVAYRDEYVMRNNGRVPGYWVFQDGRSGLDDRPDPPWARV